MERVVFGACAALAVAAGVAVFRVDSMARATYALALSFVATGVSLLLLDLAYLGVVTVLMMVMEMAIMGVFMIMFMMNPGGLMPMSMVHRPRRALVLAGGVFAALAAGVLLVEWPGRRGEVPADPTRAVGEGLMGPQMLVMMAVGAVLLATIVSALVLAGARSRYDRGGGRGDGGGGCGGRGGGRGAGGGGRYGRGAHGRDDLGGRP